MSDPAPAPEPSYIQKADAAIRDLLLEFECQPILFVGSGMPRRYFGAPNWKELLKEIFMVLPDGSDRFEYFRQKLDDDPIAIGSALSDLVFEWAWGSGREQFPASFFGSAVRKETFVKYLACKYLTDQTPEVSDVDKKYREEITALSAIRPHAIITTNYDLFLEKIFDGYEPITGQTILKYNTNSFGEIFHIHGDVSDPPTIVLTEADYSEWIDKKKYVSAKLLTYFAEHPVIIFGYGLGDANVKAILRDIGELVADDEGLIPNVYQIIWQSGELPKHPPDQAVFSVDDREYRTRAIYTNDFRWVFEALKSRSALTSINPKLVRALAARTMKLIREDIPSGKVSVDYDILERVADENDHLPTLLGIASVNNPNQSHPLTITQVAKRLGFSHWSAANKLINHIKDEKKIDIRSSDNQYHCKIKTGTGKGSLTRKWSLKSVDLLKRVRDGLDYEVEI
jgi:hypothetical protein